MTYDKFINLLKTYQTDLVRALTFSNSCAVTQIPNAFSLLIADLISFIHNHIEQFCEPDQMVGLFGMQVMTCSILSNLPKQLRRVGFPTHPQYHFCYTLNYLAFSKEKLETITDWHNYKSLVVDFTTGEIMDLTHYMYLLQFNDTPGTVYGNLNHQLLGDAWRLANKKHLKEKSWHNFYINMGTAA